MSSKFTVDLQSCTCISVFRLTLIRERDRRQSTAELVVKLKLLLFVICWLLNVPATCQCISETDLLRQFYMLPHWDRSCRSNFLPHPVTVYWHQADQSQCWPYRVATGVPLCNLTLVWLDPEKIPAQAGLKPGIFRFQADALTTRPTRRSGLEVEHGRTGG